MTKRIFICFALCFALIFQLPCYADDDTGVTVTVNIILPEGAVAADDIVGYADLVPTDESVLLCSVNNAQTYEEMNDIILAENDMLNISLDDYNSLTESQKLKILNRLVNRKFGSFDELTIFIRDSIKESQTSGSGGGSGGGGSSSESGDGDDGSGENGETGENGENAETTAYLLPDKNDYFVSDELKDAFSTALSSTEDVTIGCGGGNSSSGGNSGSGGGSGGTYVRATSILVTKGENCGTLSVSVPDEYLDADYTFTLKLSNIHGDDAYFPVTYYGAENGSSPYEDGAAIFTVADAPFNVELINCVSSDFESVGNVSGSLLLTGSINGVAPAVRINNNSDETLRDVAVYMANYSDSHKLISLTKLTGDRIAVGATASFVFEKTDLTAAPETKFLVWKDDIKPLFAKKSIK